MTISDIITIISLIIAIVAIISEKNRKQLLLKFSYLDFSLYILAFALINYFVFYNQFYAYGYTLEFLYFENYGFRNPSNYSYIISIFLLLHILFKIGVSFYPYRKLERVLSYYRTLIEKKEITLLLDLIERYHLNDIIRKIENTKNYKPKKQRWFFRYQRKKTFKENIVAWAKTTWRYTNKYSELNRFSYASAVLHRIINDEAFVVFASNTRPYFFTNIISNFKKTKRRSFPEDLINKYLKELVKEKNFWLINELKESDKFDGGQPEWFFEQNRIVSSLIKEVSVSDFGRIWKPLGEEAIKEIENEKNLGINSRLCQQYRNDELLWEYSTFISIKFFNILLIESIVQKYKGTHFFLFYYNYITERIIDNLDSAMPSSFEDVKSNYHHLIELMNENLFHWLDLADEYKNDRLHDVISCIGQQVNVLTKCAYFGEHRKVDLVKKLLWAYCHRKNKAKTEIIRDKLDEIMITPSMLTKPNDPYYSYIKEAWKDFDKIPHRGYSGTGKDLAYFKRLKTNVIIHLGLNPKQF